MHKNCVLLSIPGLRSQDLAHMPRLSALAGGSGAVRTLTPSFPCLTCTVQANLTTGVGPEQHGVIGNGFYYRDKGEFEIWTAWNECIQAPQIWEQLHQKDPKLTSAVWFPMQSKGAQADYICTFAPIHNPDGTESLWCYTRPEMLYGDLRDTLGHFPLMHFWGPLANIKSSQWIADSAVIAAERFQPRFTYIYLTHLDYAAQKFGPDSEQALASPAELDATIGSLIDGYAAAGLEDVLWLVASEYTITAVDTVCYPNRTLREAGMLTLDDDGEGRELLNVAASRAWALATHQLAHVFVKDSADIDRVAALFHGDPTVEQVLTGRDRAAYNLDHERSGEVVLIAQPNAWFAYYFWLDDDKAPSYARTIDIHNKPGFDPVEVFIDMPSKQTPLDATLVKGSHGYPATDASRQGVLILSDSAACEADELRDVDVAGICLRNFDIG